MLRPATKSHIVVRQPVKVNWTIKKCNLDQVFSFHPTAKIIRSFQTRTNGLQQSITKSVISHELSSFKTTKRVNLINIFSTHSTKSFSYFFYSNQKRYSSNSKSTNEEHNNNTQGDSTNTSNDNKQQSFQEDVQTTPPRRRSSRSLLLYLIALLGFGISVCDAYLTQTGSCGYYGYHYWYSVVESENEQSRDLPKLKDKLSTPARVALFVGALGVFGAFNLLMAPFFIVGLKRYGKIPFIPSPANQIEAMFELIPFKSYAGRTFVDLGSGDGRVVHEAAQRGFQAVGYELNPWLNFAAKQNTLKYQLTEDQVKFITGDFWQADLSKCDVVTVYGIDSAMPRLQNKLQTELKDGSYVLSVNFKLPEWVPIDTLERVWLYQKGKSDLMASAASKAENVAKGNP